MPKLWGKSLTLVYPPATCTDAQEIAIHGGLEETPAYLIKLMV